MKGAELNIKREFAIVVLVTEKTNVTKAKERNSPPITLAIPAFLNKVMVFGLLILISKNRADANAIER